MMNGMTTDWAWNWMIGFANVLEIVAVVLPVSGLCAVTLILLVPKVGNIRISMSHQIAESIHAPPASEGRRHDDHLIGALPANDSTREYRKLGPLTQNAEPGTLREEF
jgi:hypothetical protein